MCDHIPFFCFSSFTCKSLKKVMKSYKVVKEIGINLQ